MTRSIVILFLFVIGASAADPIPASRLPPGGTWEGLVGVSNGIPTYTTQSGATISNYTGTADTINTAVSGAADNAFVLLGAGTFNISSQMLIGNSFTELRGSTNANGTPSTIINFTASSDRCVSMQAGTWNLANDTGWTRRNISSGLTRGSTSITLASAPTGLSLGQLIYITNPNTVGGAPYNWYGTDGFCQSVRVSSISGSDVGFYPPFCADYLTGTSQIGFNTTGTLKRSGIRNISFTRSGGGAGYIRCRGGDECWLINVRTFDVPSGSSIYHFESYCTHRFEVRKCDFAKMTSLSHSTYCIQAQMSTSFLVIDSFFHNAPNIMPIVGMVQSAFAYNYVWDLPYTSPSQISQIVFMHGGHNSYNLLEGNWLPQSYHDAGGDSKNITYFRNRMRAWDESPTQGVEKTANCNVMVICRDHVNYTMAGNVLGENGAGKHDTLTNYWVGTGDMPGASWKIYCVESQSLPTFIRTNNYNTVTDSIASDEVLTGGQTLVDSYLFSSRPSFAHYWPLVDPANPTRAGVSGDSAAVDNLAAAYRAANSGADPNWGGPTGTPSRRQALRGIRLKI